jgi:tRNA (guanine37-N1)-methyltransferase
VHIDVVTLFPQLITPALDCAVIGRAREKGLIEIRVHNLRDWATDRHHTVDDYPYGGGAGMVLKPDVAYACVEDLTSDEPARRILMTPQGRTFTQAVAAELATEPRLLVFCARYEGVDERIRTGLIDDEISIGDYVLSGGDLAALVVVECVARLVPGVLGSEESVEEESFSQGLLEYPHYTRPPEFRGTAVPEILVSGHHERVRRWRRCQSILRTRERRPDLMEGKELSEEDKKILREFGEE